MMDGRLTLPRRKRGRQSAKSEAEYQERKAAFCADMAQIASTLDFDISSRGWAYILEEHGLSKGEFDAAERFINKCRKSGDLPLDICAEDQNRLATNIEVIDEKSPADEAAAIVEYLDYAHMGYTPNSFWNDLDFYVQMFVEKIDLKNLFDPICARYHVPLTNVRGWACINSRAATMRRFSDWESRGKRCVLLYCGDHDPGGLQISEFLRGNFNDLFDAVGWRPDNLLIDRFGLNADFVAEQNLTWIDNLETSSGGRLDDPKHPDHRKSYVQDYFRQFGTRKVEANALVVRPEAGRNLCEQAILKYVPDDSLGNYEDTLAVARDGLRIEVANLVQAGRS